MIGKQLLNYKIVSLIGEGGMGNVYLGEHTSIGRKVAIKVLRPELASNEEIRSRFKNEASVMARLQHPGIVSLFDYVENDEGLFLIMEYVEGIEITDLLKALDEPLSIDRAKDVMKKVLSAFSFAHKHKIVHRDVKPSNILLTKDDEVKVLDFGIAKLIGGSEFNLTKTGTQVGTVYYMSPEQVKAKELDQRSDIYSLGITFYELLAGFCPYKSMKSEFEVYEKIVREPLLPLTEVMGKEYGHVWTVIQKATEKEAADRFQSCDEFIRAIDFKEIGSSPSASEPVKTQGNQNTQPQPVKKQSNGAATAGLVLGIIGLVLAFIPFASFVGFFLCLIAVFLSVKGISNIRKNPVLKPTKGTSTAGLILGIIGLLVSIAMSIFIIFLIQEDYERKYSSDSDGDGIPDMYDEGSYVFWFDGDKTGKWEGNVTIYIDDEYAGEISDWYYDSPGCNSSGCVTVTRAPGTYLLDAYCVNGTVWEDYTFEITEAGCGSMSLWIE